jgi:AraC-like DNA-binding protein
MPVLDAPPPDLRLLQFISDQMPDSAERFDFWRDVITRKLLRLAIDRLDDTPFRADAMLRCFHGLTIGVGEIGPTVNHRTREIVAADNDDLVLMANLDGPFVTSTARGDQTLEQGEAILVSCGQVGTYIRPTAGRLLCARVPSSALARLVPDPDERAGVVIPRESEALRMLVAYASNFWDEDFVVDPVIERFLVDHVCDLVALTVGARGDAAELASGRGGRAAKLKAAKDAIEARIGPNELSAEDVALEIGVSPRYVRKLFEAQGLSFSRYVAERRLERARAMLQSPRCARLTVSAIAYDVGFGDLSYFNRAFRRRFDRTPSELRAEAAGSASAA